MRFRASAPEVPPRTRICPPCPSKTQPSSGELRRTRAPQPPMGKPPAAQGPLRKHAAGTPRALSTRGARSSPGDSPLTTAAVPGPPPDLPRGPREPGSTLRAKSAHHQGRLRPLDPAKYKEQAQPAGSHWGHGVHAARVLGGLASSARVRQELLAEDLDTPRPTFLSSTGRVARPAFPPPATPHERASIDLPSCSRSLGWVKGVMCVYTPALGGLRHAFACTPPSPSGSALPAARPDPR
jgi:hypothetical protein